MKRIRLIGIVSVIALVSFNLSILKDKNDSAEMQNKMKLDFFKTAMAYDLEEVTVTCSNSGWGKCYEEVWFWFKSCDFTGCQSDFCW